MWSDFTSRFRFCRGMSRNALLGIFQGAHPGSNGNLFQPTPKRGIGLKTFDSMPGLHEHFLAQLVRLCCVPTQAAKQSTNVLLATSHQFAKCCEIARTR